LFLFLKIVALTSAADAGDEEKPAENRENGKNIGDGANLRYFALYFLKKIRYSDGSGGVETRFRRKDAAILTKARRGRFGGRTRRLGNF